MAPMSALVPAAALSAPGTLPATLQRREYGGEGGPRPYSLYLPARPAAAPLPLLVLLHGCTQDAADIARGTRMNALAAELGFAVVYPEQLPSAHPQRCWSWYEPAHQRRGAGEPASIAGVTREVMREHPIDPARVYVAGISAGGAMAVIQAAAYPELYAAVASHSGTPHGAAASVAEALRLMKDGPPAGLDGRLAEAMGERRRLVPAILFQGAADPVVSPANLDGLVAQWEALARSAGTELSADPAPEVRREAELPATRTAYRTPDGRTVLVRWDVQGLGHAWSGGSPEGSYTDARGPDAAREMLAFLLQNSLPARE